MRHAVLVLLVGLTVAAAGGSLAAGAAVRIAAHRGGAGLWPEASLGAFRPPTDGTGLAAPDK